MIRVIVEPHEMEDMEVTISITMPIADWRMVEEDLRRKGGWTSQMYAGALRDVFKNFFGTIDSTYKGEEE